MTQDEPSTLLRDLVFEYLEGSEERPAHLVLDELCQRHPEVARELRSRVALLPANYQQGSAAPPTEPTPTRTHIGPFELRGELGGGAMGVVYRAYDPKLDRDVALKVIRLGELLFDGGRERFRREVEVIARLAHPGIVPIHSTGEDQGIPWFAMELVEGCALSEAIKGLKELHEASGDVSGARLGAFVKARVGARRATAVGPAGDSPLDSEASWPRACARIARDIAEALEHAHRRGVLHRDVKPSNVMVTPDGRVVLLDFGLSSMDGSDRITRTGAALGSLAYMSPEQLDGDLARVGPAADVYSLGVTLYELLTFRLPYQAPSLARLRESVAEGRFPPPRSIDPTISIELETIVHVALDPDPARRYVSAAAMAADLSAALDGRPIAARRPSPLRRAQLWAARRPAAAGLVAVLTLVAFGGPLLFGWQQRQSRIRTEDQARIIEAQRNTLTERNEELAAAIAEERRQRERAREESVRAERNLSRAIDAVDTMVTRVSEDDLSAIPGLELVRREVLERALSFFRALAADQDGDPRLRRELAQAWRRVGDIEGWLDRRAEALAALDRADQLLRELIDDLGPQRELVRELADIGGLRSMALRLRGQPEQARAAIEDALAFLDRLTAEDRSAPEVAGAHGELLLQLAQAYRGEGRPAETRTVLEGALESLRTARIGRELELQPTLQLARVHQLLGVLATEAPPKAESFAECAAQQRQVVELLRPLEERFGKNVALRRDLSRGQMNLGSALMKLGSDEALERVQDGMERAVALAADFPSSGTFAVDSATAQMIVGVTLMAEGRAEEGLQLLRSGADSMQAAHALSPNDMDVLVRLAGARLQEGTICLQVLGRPAEALERLEEAARWYDKAYAQVPNFGQVRLGRELAREFRARTHLTLADPAAAASAAFELAELVGPPPRQIVAAALLAECAEALERGAAIEQARACDARAVELVRTALGAGFEPASAGNDPALKALAAREATRALVGDR